MGRVAVQFLDEGLHRVLFDAMPMPAFVVDKDVNVLECNAAAARLSKQAVTAHKPRRAGEVLHCLHAAESPKGCGRASACSDCELLDTVRMAAGGESVTRQWAEMELMQSGKPTRVNLRISCQPFSYNHNDLILLILEGLND